MYPIVVDVIAGQTIDQDNGLYVEDGYVLEAPPGRWEFISPLTTLVNQELDKNPSFTQQQAVLSVKSQLGIADNISVFDNYLEDASASIAGSLEKARTHRVAQIIARMMGLLNSAIRNNIGRDLVTNEAPLLSYMISDQIAQQASLVKTAMDYERNYAVTTDVGDLVSDLYSRVPVSTLNEGLMENYAQRVAQEDEIWDMIPPQVVSFTPAEGTDSSIETTVTVTFDEALDNTQDVEDVFALIGPHGEVSATMVYDPALKKLTFSPVQVLGAYSEYEVVLKSNLADAKGNTLGEDISWVFATTFDQTPPALPEF